MRHLKRSKRLGRTTSHRKAMFCNMVKSFIVHEQIETTVAKGKEFKRVLEPLITLAKNDTLANRREVMKLLSIKFNKLTSKEKKIVKGGNNHPLNYDRSILGKLFGVLAKRFKDRMGGYTKIVRTRFRVGDMSEMCRVLFA